MLINNTLREGRKTQSAVSLDALIPEDHIIRKIDAAICWDQRCAPMRSCYNAERGRPAFEPEVLLAIALLRHIYHMDSLRGATVEIQTNLVYRWFIGCPLGESVPHFSTISSNMLHRIPRAVFDAAFAGALCDILDAGVLSPDDLIYPSVFLNNHLRSVLSERYLMCWDQLSLILPEKESNNAPANAGQISMIQG